MVLAKNHLVVEGEEEAASTITWQVFIQDFELGGGGTGW